MISLSPRGGGNDFELFFSFPIGYFPQELAIKVSGRGITHTHELNDVVLSIIEKGMPVSLVRMRTTQ